MPREQINFPNLASKNRAIAAIAHGEIPASDFGPWNDASLHVSWRPAGDDSSDTDGHVQVAFEADLNMVAMAASSPNGVSDDRTVMWSPVLDEAEIDRLISALRKAKRKAYPKA